jgi:transcriptional regulator NrdR family protein
MEVAIPPEARVLKQHGRSAQAFDGGKIKAALARIAKDGLLSAKAIEEIAFVIESGLREDGRPWIDSLEIAQSVVRLLEEVEPRAAARFLANYDGTIVREPRPDVGRRRQTEEARQKELPFGRTR